MLDGLLGRGFSSKSKSLIKLVKARIDLIRRKRNAVQKFLKKDIADLLKNGLDINAYGRAAGLLVELDLSYCYDAVEQFCVHISSHLPVMQRQSECPDECKEAVSSLMFAAARFADLPELRDLRHMFTEKYGNSVEHFVNQEFVKKLSSNPPTVDTKLELMQAIAKEFSIKWDRKAFEQTLSPAPASAKQDYPKRLGQSDSCNDGWKIRAGHDNAAVKRDVQHISSVGRWEPADKTCNSQDGQEDNSLKRDKREASYQEQKQPVDSSYKHHHSRDETVALERHNPDVSSRGTRELSNGVYKVRDGLEEAAQRDNQDILPHTIWGRADNGFKLSNGRETGVSIKDNRQKYFDDRSEQEMDRVETLHGGGNGVISSHREKEHISRHARKHAIKTDHKEIIQDSSSHHNEPEKVPAETENIKPPKYNNFIPPPYVKPNVRKHGAHHDKSPSHNRGFSHDTPESVQSGLEHVNHDRLVANVEPARINGLEDQKTHYGETEDVIDVKSKPRSVRRRPKPPMGQESTSKIGVEEIEKRHHRRSRRREDAKRLGLQYALDEDHEPTDEEEKMMDRLLIHYSKKPSKYEEIKVRSRMNAAAPSSQATAAEIGESQSNRRVDGPLSQAGPPIRIRSLPTEPVTPTGASRVPARATSLEPDMFNQAGHVHPKLPDYDDLAARFAALRGR